MEKFWQKIKIIIEDPNLRKRMIFVIGALIIFRLLAAIPIPGVDKANLAQFLSNNDFLGVLNIFSGGGLSNLSIIMLGVGPYITGSIIMQLLTIMSPKLKAMYSEEGEAGKKKFTQYSRLLTVPLAVIQGFGLLSLLSKSGVMIDLSPFAQLLNIVVITAGSILVMWVGELITEYGIGNGVSLIIFAGIIAQLPSSVTNLAFSFDMSQLLVYIAFAVATIAVIAGVVFITEAERPIPVTYAKQIRGNKTSGGVSTYIPLRLNQAGVIPIIFALSILLFPKMIGTVLATSSHPILQNIGSVLSSFAQGGLLYGLFYFILVFIFTYFYTAVTFDPKAMSENLQKNGAFVPGIRPGEATATYVSNILNRITLVGALFLGLIAVLPIIMQSVTGIQSLALGGTALLIVVSVVIDLVKKIDAQISMREY